MVLLHSPKALSNATFEIMSASPKIPVVITDKNNRVTTVYRNPVPSIPLNVPPPMPVQSESAESRAARAMVELGIDETYQQTAMFNLQFLAGRAPDLLERIIERCADDARENKLWNNQLCHFYDANVRLDHDAIPRYEWRYELQPTAIKVGLVIAPGEIGHFTTDNMMERVSMMHRRGPVKDWDLQHARVIGIGIEQTPRLITPEHEFDVAFIKSNLNAVEAILPELAARKTIDRSVVEELLNHPAPMLREGHL